MSVRTRIWSALVAVVLSCSALAAASPAHADRPDPGGGGGTTDCMAMPQVKKEGGYVMARMHVYCARKVGSAHVIGAQVILQRETGNREVKYSDFTDSRCSKKAGQDLWECFGSWAKLKDPAGSQKYLAMHSDSNGTFYLTSIYPGGPDGGPVDGEKISCIPADISSETIACPKRNLYF